MRAIYQKVNKTKQNIQNIDPQRRYQMIREEIIRKVEALIWVLVSSFVFAQSQFLKYIWMNKSKNLIFDKIFKISIILELISMSLFLISDSLRYRNQNFLKNNFIEIIANFLLILIFLSSFIVTYHVYKWKTIFMLPLFGMGLLLLPELFSYFPNQKMFLSLLVFLLFILQQYTQNI